MCLNPCFNGIWSRTCKEGYPCDHIHLVLILVLMEYDLGLHNYVTEQLPILVVLILVLMEDGLGPFRWRV